MQNHVLSDMIVHFIIENWKINTLFSKSIQAEKGKFSHTFIFQFLNDKMHSYVWSNIIVNFIIQKLINKHTFPQKYTNWAKLSSLKLTEWEETKTRYFAPLSAAARKTIMHSSWSAFSATSRAVKPRWSRTVIEAPLSTKTDKLEECPCSAATCKAVRPGNEKVKIYIKLRFYSND